VMPLLGVDPLGCTQAAPEAMVATWSRLRGPPRVACMASRLR
jgi:hypothetical protein